MSYSVFLILFVCLPLTGMFYVLRRAIRRIHLIILLALAVIAIVYTTPWDNYLVASGVWYYDPKLVFNITLGYVPLEEYLFFILQSFLTGIFAFWLWQRFYTDDFAERSDHKKNNGL
ncbi:MAG: lycopene cyclase domain-containing protein [Chloroflexota bacterium]